MPDGREEDICLLASDWNFHKGSKTALIWDRSMTEVRDFVSAITDQRVTQRKQAMKILIKYLKGNCACGHDLK